MARSAGAFHANFQASLAVARDLDEWIEEELEAEAEEGFEGEEEEEFEGEEEEYG
jgi:shikimate kinase